MKKSDKQKKRNEKHLDTMRYISYIFNDENNANFSSNKATKFELEFYATEDGKEPVADFLDSLDRKMNAKMISLMELLEEIGTELREPYSTPLGDGIFELRCKVGTNITRALYFFYVGKRIVVTNGFVKKTQKTPVAEIKLAKKRRKEWLRRHKQETMMIRR